jgi:hypothetical protein
MGGGLRKKKGAVFGCPFVRVAALALLKVD